MLASVDSKPLIQTLSPLDATLMNKQGGGVAVMVNQTLHGGIKLARLRNEKSLASSQ